MGAIWVVYLWFPVTPSRLYYIYVLHLVSLSSLSHATLCVGMQRTDSATPSWWTPTAEHRSTPCIQRRIVVSISPPHNDSYCWATATRCSCCVFLFYCVAAGTWLVQEPSLKKRSLEREKRGVEAGGGLSHLSEDGWNQVSPRNLLCPILAGLWAGRSWVVFIFSVASFICSHHGFSCRPVPAAATVQAQLQPDAAFLSHLS